YDAVYIALGAPDEVRTITISDGSTRTLWNYFKRHETFHGEQTIGYEEVTTFDPASGRYIIHQEPIREGNYATRNRRHLQVIFTDERVSSAQFANRPASADRN